MTSTFLRPLSIGEILDGAFALYRSRFTTLTGSALALFAPALALGIAADVVEDPLNALMLWFGFWALQGLAGLASTGANVWAASQMVLDRPLSLDECLGKGLGKIVPLLFGTVIFAVCIVVGTCMFVVPAVLLWIMWFARAPVIVLEGRWDFFGRSRDLARGSWLKIFVVMSLSTIIALLPTLLVQGTGFAAMFFAEFSASMVPPAWLTTSSVLGTALTIPFSNCALTLLYYDQRVRKEGLDVELLVSAIGSIETAGSASRP